MTTLLPSIPSVSSFLQKFLPITRGRDRNINFICILTMPIKFIPRPRIIRNKPYHPHPTLSRPSFAKASAGKPGRDRIPSYIKQNRYNSRLKIQKNYILRCEGRVNNPRDCSVAPTPSNRVANRRQRKQCCRQQK
jgi:hypothetical protein